MKKQIKLVVSVIMDIVGYFSYTIPGMAEISDIIFAPITAIWIQYAYKDVLGAGVGFLEELSPGMDFIPTCTIVHFGIHKKYIR